MRKFYLVLVSVFLVSVANAQFDMEKLTVYGGVSILPVKTVDFEDFHISDWENYGLGSSEGRVVVPLEANKPKTSIGIITEQLTVMVKYANILQERLLKAGTL